MIEEERPDDAPLEGSEPTAAPDEAPAGDEPAAEAPEQQPAEEAPAEETAPAEEAPAAAEEPAPAAAEEPAPAAAEETAPAEEEPPAAAEEEPAPAPAPAEAQQRPPRPEKKPDEPEVIPGAHLEPDLVLEQPAAEDDEYAQYAEPAGEGEEAAEGEEAEAAPAVRSPLDLAADARYQATGKRKTAIARVVLKPGDGTYTINGRALEEFFPRTRLQKAARHPLEATGNHQRMDVIARIHGGGVAAQAGALRHGIARALVEASPELRTELKRRGYLTRDPREKERKKAGLKKARKRPQFSKR